MLVLGLDIGGANVKAVYARPTHGYRDVDVLGSYRVYHPIWIRGLESLRQVLMDLKQRFGLEPGGYVVGVTMTAELSDIFRTKFEGVKSIVEVVEDVYSDSQGIYYVTVDMELVKASEAIKNYLRVAAANWAATAWLMRYRCRDWRASNAILIDIGSTTTTIIPMVNCEVRVRGYTDPEKLVYGELVYTGILRTNVAAIVDKVPYKGFFAKVSSERFALTSDAHLVLGHISPEDYTTETADGRGRSVEEAAQRLARVPCADSDILSFEEIVEIARYVYEKQVFQVFEALMQIRSWLASQRVKPNDFTVITAGIGEFLASEAARRAGFNKIVSINSFVGKEIAGVLPSYALTLMVMNKVLRS